MKKAKDLLIILAIYVLAYGLGVLGCRFFENTMLKFFVFDVIATVVMFIFSTVLVNSSVYDAYWSLTPMVMSIWLFIESRAFSPYQIAFLIVFNMWSLRLTINWITVFTDFSYEDWRYRHFRKTTPKLLWPIVNFGGIHFVPTLFVFSGMLPLFDIVKNPLGVFSIPGMAVILSGALLQHLADRDMHAFLAESAEEGTKRVCERGLWRFSRHPNYLGEILMWLGVYLVMLPYVPGRWYWAVGFVSIAFMFNVISIPLMEKRQLERRAEYVFYKRTTSRLLLLPKRKAL